MPSPREGRRLGLDLLDPPGSGDFGVNLSKGRALGIDFIALHVTWTGIEPTPMQFEDPFGAIEALHDVAADEGWQFSLTIRPIDLTGKTVPSDLETTRFNDPALIARFEAVLDHVMTLVDADRLVSLQIGNEVDGFDSSAEHPDFWSDYGAFLFAVERYMQERHPNLRIGFTGTAHGMTEGPLAELGVFTALAGVVDVVGITHYPLDDGFGVRPTGDAFADLDAMAAAFPGKPILLQEVGYQSSATSNSSTSAQAEFYCDFFSAWDAHRDQIETANIVRLNDTSLEGARELAGPYGLDNDAFVEYLRTLGIREHAGDGTDKPAFEVIRSAWAARE